MWNKNAVESPDSAQPKPPQVGSRSSVALRDCSGARKVVAPVGPAARLGEEAGVPGEEAGVLGGVVGPVTGPEVLAVLTGPAVLAGEDAAELAEEAQAVNRTATHARDAQDAICRVLSTFVISMMSNLQSMSERLGEPCHTYDAERPALVGKPLHRAGTTVRSEYKSRLRPQPKHWPSPR
jgi:hypothetical protein